MRWFESTLPSHIIKLDVANDEQSEIYFKLPIQCEVTVNNSPYTAITANENSTLTLQNNGGNNPDLQYSTDGIN